MRSMTDQAAEAHGASGGPSSPTGPPAASVGSRMAAGLIDLALAALVVGGLGAAWYVVDVLPAKVAAAGILGVLALREIVLGATGQTLGGVLTGTRMVDAATGGRPGWRLFIHADLLAVCGLPTLGLGLLFIMRTVRLPEGMGWHDRMSGTRVVCTRRSAAPAGPDVARQEARVGGLRATAPVSATPTASQAQPGGSPAASSPAPARPAAAETATPAQGFPTWLASNRVAWDVVPDTLTEAMSERAPVLMPQGDPEVYGLDAGLAAYGSLEGDEAQDTFNATRVLPPGAGSQQAPIGSVPWSAAPTFIDPPTQDLLAVADVQEPGTPEPAGTRSTQTQEPARPAAPRRRHASSSTQVVLVPVDGVGQSLTLTGTAVVGREPENISTYPDAMRIALADPTRSVSKTHAALAPVDGGVWVTDLHSTNGTRVEQEGEVEKAEPNAPVPAPVGATVFFGKAAYRITAA